MTETMEVPTIAGAGTPLLEARNVTKSFGSVQALAEVDFAVHAGEVMALVGDNGAGKSTLIKCIAGIYPIDSGDVYFDGKKVSIGSPKAAADLGIEVVYQDLALCDNLDIVQNMYLGREEHDVIRRLKEPEMEARTAATMKSLAVVIISHNLHDVFEVADRITCLRLGRNVAVFERREATQQEVVHAITAGVPTKVSGIAGTGLEEVL